MNKGVAFYQTKQRLESLTILQRIAKTDKSDKSAVDDCVAAYGNLVWALAKKYTHSTVAAEEAVLKIFNKIWSCAALYDSAKCTEEKYILRVAFRHLLTQAAPGDHHLEKNYRSIH